MYQLPQSKRCSICHVDKPSSEFHRQKRKLKSGEVVFRLTAACILCRNLKSRERYQKNAGVYRQASISRYHQNREWYLAYAKTYYSLNKEKITAYMLDWNSKNKQWRRDWEKKNRSKRAAKERARSQRVRRNSPIWMKTNETFKAEIKAIYQACIELNKKDGPRSWHVDHIFPLKGPNSCGLHVPWNLRIVRAEENLKKGNKESVLVIS